MNKLSRDNFERPSLKTPNEENAILLHSCCAPCAGEIMEALAASNIKTKIFFYNPNIHPRDEYEIRKEEHVRFAAKMGMEFYDADYDTENWFERVKGLENEPERGERCSACFDMRFERSALYASENGFSLFTSTLGISRFKDINQVNQSALRAASRYPNLCYWTFNWRKKGGSQRKIEIAQREQFYQQEYCGCVYSLRDSNKYRKEKGRPLIERGVKFYGKEDLK
jgi:predicted adenine nucleotide alpha hydrolase (AANH) superfamily ATPase